MQQNELARLSLEDVLGGLWYARRSQDLGRLARLVHFDLRHWAVAANQHLLAQSAKELVVSCPQRSRDEFLSKVDALIREAERVHERMEMVAA
jgi:hypothetical protein